MDLAIIGSGPGGYQAAIYAAQKGLKVAVIEAREVGGVCLHAGCIPTKAMLASLDLLRQARRAESMGLALNPGEVALDRIVTRRQKVVQQLAQGVRYLLEKNQVELIHGHGYLTSAEVLEVHDGQGNTIRTINQPKAILLATGSRPAGLPHAPCDGINILNSNDLLRLTEVPAELIIVGGGYIGCEFASMFAPLNCRVTILEALDRLLPNLDKELGQALERSFAKAGLKIVLQAQVAQIQAGEGVKVNLADGQSFAGAKVLVSVGRIPNLEQLGLENARVQFGPSGIAVNEFMQTNVPHIYAIGDVTGKIALAHVASAQGRLVIDHLVKRNEGLSTSMPAGSASEPALEGIHYEAVPACVFTHPEIASVGLSEQQAAQRGLTVKIGRFPFAASGKAQATGETDGFIKLVADAHTGRLLGGHIFGSHAAELIAALTLAVRWGLTAVQMTHTIFAHPTLGEAMFEAAEGVFGRPTHIFTRR